MRSNDEIFEELNELGLCQSERDIGRLFGRSESWWSSTKARQRNLSVESMINCLMKIDEIIVRTKLSAEQAETEEDRKAYREGYVSLKMLRREIYEEVFRHR